MEEIDKFPVVNNMQIGKYPFFCAQQSGLVYHDILEYRVIVPPLPTIPSLPEIYSFASIQEAIQYSNELQKNSNIVVLVQQNGYYLPSENGKILETNTGQRYQYHSNSRICEWQLSQFSNKPQIQLI